VTRSRRRRLRAGVTGVLGRNRAVPRPGTGGRRRRGRSIPGWTRPQPAAAPA